jgi:hypothetical protein
MTVYAHLPVLVAVVSLVYSATRHDRRDKIVREALHWALRMTTFLLTIGLVLFALSTFL